MLQVVFYEFQRMNFYDFLHAQKIISAKDFTSFVNNYVILLGKLIFDFVTVLEVFFLSPKLLNFP